MSSGRENVSCRATIDRSSLFAQGRFKLAYRGEYTEGMRKGAACVAKMFKTGSVFEDAYFDTELKTVNRALQLVDSFNRAGIIDQQIQLNMPTVWEFEYSKERCLIEPMIKNFENFNSNSGWTPRVSSAWTDAMQALSHFSYHISNKQVLLCDLQGGSYRKGFVLTDPVVMSSNNSQAYGPTDLGPRGISTFFAHHQCNRFCRSNWGFPADHRAYFPKQQGSTMAMNHVPTRHSRPPMSAAVLPIYEESDCSDEDY